MVVAFIKDGFLLNRVYFSTAAKAARGPVPSRAGLAFGAPGPKIDTHPHLKGATAVW